MILIGLTGAAGSGKDTVARHLCDTHGFVQIALADPIREGLKAMFGLSDTQMTTRGLKEWPIDWLGRSPRQLMQTLGTEWGRTHVADDLWLRVAARKIAGLRQSPPCLHIAGVVVSDIRFENEADWLRAQGGRLVHILRPDTAPVAAHASEAGVLYSQPRNDVILDNDGSIEDLEDLVSSVVSALQPPVEALP